VGEGDDIGIGAVSLKCRIAMPLFARIFVLWEIFLIEKKFVLCCTASLFLFVKK
jgi:hypothetical protein